MEDRTLIIILTGLWCFSTAWLFWELGKVWKELLNLRIGIQAVRKDLRIRVAQTDLSIQIDELRRKK